MTKKLVIAVCLQLVAVLVVEAVPEYGAECVVWQNVTEVLMYEKDVPMNCQKNAQCTGYDCTSKFTYSGPLTMQQDFSVDFCFGIAIHPCDHPLSMSFYVENPGDTETFQQKVHSDQTFQLTGVHYSFTPLGSADGFVAVTMEPQMYQGYKYVKLGVHYKTKVKIGFYENWPSELAFSLMPETLVPVPPCDSRVKTDLHAPGTCTAFVPPTRAPGFTTMYPPTPGPNCTVGEASCPDHEVCQATVSGAKGGNCVCTPGYFRQFFDCVLHPDNRPMPMEPCVLNEFNSCKGAHQVCREKDGSGTCECMTDFKWDGSICKSTGPTPDVLIIGEPDAYATGGSSGSGSSGGLSGNYKIIIPVIAGVVVAILVIAAVVVIRYRRYRARYGQHALLLAEDDDLNDGDEQMVEA